MLVLPSLSLRTRSEQTRTHAGDGRLFSFLVCILRQKVELVEGG